MLRSFLMIALRKILKNKGSSYLNIIGLTLSMSICLFIFHYIYFESTYDSSPSAFNVYRIESQIIGQSGYGNSHALTSLSAGPFLQQQFDEIGNITRIIPFSEEGTGLFRRVVNDNEKSIYIPKVYYAEPSVLVVFDLELIEGDNKQCLSLPNSIILSSSLAKKIFDDGVPSPIGQVFKSPGLGDVVEEYIVTGIFADRPINSHLKFDALVAKDMHSTGFDAIRNAYSYITIEGAVSQNLNSGIETLDDENNSVQLTVRPISQIHTSENVSGNPEPGVNLRLLIFLAAIGTILILLSATNHTNNTIFNSIDRAREIGVRKLLGIRPKQLFMSFVGEALLVNFIAIVLSILIFWIGVVVLDAQTDVSYPGVQGIHLWKYVLCVFTLLIISTLLSGLYPALYLTSLKPIAALKSKNELMNSSQFSSASRVIQLLLIFQLSISILFLTSLYIVYAQLEFMKERGRSPMEITITGLFPGASGVGKKFTEEVYHGLNEYQRTRALESYSISNLYNNQLKTVQKIKLDSLNEPVKLSVVNHSYFTERKFSFLSGSNFDHRFGYDAGNAIISTSLLTSLNYQHPDSILGKKLHSKGSRWTVTGVVNDSFEGENAIYVTGFRYRTYVDVVLNYPGGRGESLDQFLGKNEYYLSQSLPFFTLLKRNYQKQGKNEKYLMNMFLFFSIMTLIIANMGMFGLSSFVTQKRQKEIGIRKIHGAESIQILLVLIVDFLKLVALAALIAVPVVLFASQRWLENYAYRISIEPLMIMTPLLVVFSIALIVVGERCHRLAVSSPLHSLKD